MRSDGHQIGTDLAKGVFGDGGLHGRIVPAKVLPIRLSSQHACHDEEDAGYPPGRKFGQRVVDDTLESVVERNCRITSDLRGQNLDAGRNWLSMALQEVQLATKPLPILATDRVIRQHYASLAQRQMQEPAGGITQPIKTA